jgi:hypothetical protein
MLVADPLDAMFGCFVAVKCDRCGIVLDRIGSGGAPGGEFGEWGMGLGPECGNLIPLSIEDSGDPEVRVFEAPTRTHVKRETHWDSGGSLTLTWTHRCRDAHGRRSTVRIRRRLDKDPFRSAWIRAASDGSAMRVAL